MKNHSLYIHAPQRKRELDVASDGMPKHRSEIFTIGKAKRSDVPPMYRRNRKRDALNIALLIASGLALLNCILFFASL